MRNWIFFDFADPELGTWTINHDMFGVVQNYALGALSCAINTFIPHDFINRQTCTRILHNVPMTPARWPFGYVGTTLLKLYCEFIVESNYTQGSWFYARKIYFSSIFPTPPIYIQILINARLPKGYTIFVFNKITSRTFVLSMNCVVVASQVVVNNVTHSQSQWRGRGDVNIRFLIIDQLFSLKVLHSDWSKTVLFIIAMITMFLGFIGK